MNFKIGDIVKYDYFTPEFIEKYKNHTYRIVEVFFDYYKARPLFDSPNEFVLFEDAAIILVKNNELTPEEWFDIQLQRKN